MRSARGQHPAHIEKLPQAFRPTESGAEIQLMRQHPCNVIRRRFRCVVTVVVLAELHHTRDGGDVDDRTLPLGERLASGGGRRVIPCCEQGQESHGRKEERVGVDGKQFVPVLIQATRRHVSDTMAAQGISVCSPGNSRSGDASRSMLSHRASRVSRTWSQALPRPHCCKERDVGSDAQDNPQK